MENKECCYQEMSPQKVHEQTEVPCHDGPYVNAYENSKWNSKGYNQSGFKGE